MSKSVGVSVWAAVLACAGCIGVFASRHAAGEAQVPEVRYPRVDVALDRMEARIKAQRETLQQFKVFYDFQFTDKLKESGITFVHHAVPEATYNYMAVHYDHGTGVAVADVDGDGRYDIYFVNQVGGNELWKNLGNGKFTNITDEAGVGLKDRISVAASFADVNNTGRPDLFVTTVDQGNVLFRNDGNGHFTNVTGQSGLGSPAHSSGALFFDYDRDGLLDLLVCNVGIYTTDQKGPAGEYVGLPDAFFGHLHPERFKAPVLYKNLGNYRFKDVTADMGLNPKIWSGDADIVDLNEDGWPDIYFLNMQGANHYFENQGGKKFVDKTSRSFPRTPWGAMGIKFFDYDNDGRMDLYVTDMHSDMMMTDVPPQDEKKKVTHPIADKRLGGPASNYIFGNAFYHNLGGGKFEEVSDKIGVETYWPWGVSVGDVNADGWDDIFVTAGMNFPFRYGINSMLLNNGGVNFLASEFLLGIEPRRVPYTQWFVMNCSGSLTPLKQKVCRGFDNTKIMVMAPKASRSSVLFDLDDDGALDIVTNDFNSEPQVLVSNLAQRKKIHWLKVLLIGSKSNREGLGAIVHVTAGGQTYIKYNDGKSGYLSQSALPLYFGLGDAAKIERVEVHWPSGQVQTVRENLSENHVLVIAEPK